MKMLTPTTALLLLALAPMSQAAAGEPAAGPCFSVEVQNDRANQASVHQDCDRNVRRTVQAGAENRAETRQHGEVNDNKTRQYQYDPPQFGERLRGN